MTGHGRRLAIAIAIGMVAGAALLSVVVPNASAASTPTSVSLNATRRGWVKVQWHFTTSVSHSNLSLEIDRGSSASNLTKIITVLHPRERSSRYDKTPMGGTSYYRVVLVKNGTVMSTSAISSITEGSSGTTTPTTAVTTTTTKSTTTTTNAPPTTIKTTTTTAAPSDGCSTAIADIERLVNAARRTAGVGPLSDNAKLDHAAQTHSTWMATTGNFAHDGWDTEISNAGYHGYSLIGQNIAGGQTTAESAMSAWMGSSGHRDNILNATYTNMGVGCTHVNKGYGWYWTQDFGNGS